MKTKILEKITVILLIFVMTFSYWGVLAGEVYAEYEELENQKVQTNNKNVEFDTYFKENGQSMHVVNLDKDSQGKFYINIAVKDGYLKQISVNVDNPNFSMQEIEGTEIALDEIENQKEIEVPFVFEKQELIDENYFSRETAITLNATYVDKNGKTKQIEAERKILVNWTKEVVVDSEQKTEKVVDLGSGRYLIQTNLKVNIRENSVPVQNTRIEILNPIIENTEIEDVKIYAIKTTMSNGIENTLGLTKENWKYSQEESKLVVELENSKTDDGKISWKDGEDEFKLIYILNSQEQNIDGKDIKLQVSGNVKYNNIEVPFENSAEEKIALAGKLVDMSYLWTESINKGYMYASSNETIYYTRVLAEISYSEIIDYLDIKMNKDTFVLESGDRINTNATIYKNTQISKSNFDALFGEEGKLEIYGNGIKVAEINKESQANEAGNIVINYEEEINSLEILTSKPVAEGKLEINNEKAVKAETGYETEKIKAIKEIETKAEVKTNITDEEKIGTVRLNETVSKAEITMLTDNLSTVVKNENVEMRVLFRTDSNMYDLYKNPTIEIELPSQVEEVSLKSIEAAFGEGFSLNWYDIVENAEGKKVIRIALNGEQRKYAMDISEGMSLTIKADMTLDKKSVSSEEIVKLRYTNERAIGYDNGGEAEGKVRIEAPTGVVAINSIKIEGNTSTSLSSKEQTEEIEILTDKKVATMTIDVINNYEKEIVNPSIIGRIPFEGNKKANGEDLGSTFTAAMVKGIEKTEGIEAGSYKIYYSSNAEATEELGKAENGWTEVIEEAGEVKAYLIEIENYTMEQGEVMSFAYDVEIPEGLNHNESSYGTYEVNYEVEEAEGLRQESIVAPTVGATTGAGPEIEVSLEANIQYNSEVEEGQEIKYIVKVENVGDVDTKNVQISTVIPKNATYLSSSPKGTITQFTETNTIGDENIEIKRKKLTIDVGTIEKNEVYTATYTVKVDALPDEEEITQENSILRSSATVTADDLGKELKTNEYINQIVKGNFNIELSALFEDEVILTKGDKNSLTARVINVNEEVKTNAIVTYKVPSGLNYIDAVISSRENTTEGIKYDSNSRILTVSLGNVTGNEVVAIKINVEISEFEKDVYEKRIVSTVSVKADQMNQEKVSNEIINIAGREKLVAIQTSNKDKYVNSGEKIEYYIEIANQGKGDAKGVVVTDILPKELTYVSFKYELEGKTGSGSNSDDNYKIKLDIPAGKTALVTMVAKAVKQEKEEIEITNKVEIATEDEKISVNSLTHTLISNNSIVTPDGEQVSVYNISGTAWEDTNKDAKKDTGEAKLSNIGVILVDNETGNIATKASSSEQQRTTTDSNGEYRFSEVKSGKYTVVFLYDAAKYTITEYKKSGLLESENSDAIKTQIKMDGNIQIAGVTEEININSNSITGINIGLIKMDSAIFGIDKVVTKIVMKNTKTSRTAEYKDSKLAKMDVDAKYITSTNLVIEYKIKVTNEGSVEGYVKKIVDKVPSEFKFSTDSNKDWYLGTNGEVYNTSLANTVIKPGETKEVTLVLTKKMTENGTGIVHNTAEITEVYNEYGVNNFINNDSTRTAADVVIAIKTGNAVTYTLLALAIIACLGTGIYFINKKVIKKY